MALCREDERRGSPGLEFMVVGGGGGVSEEEWAIEVAILEV